MPVLRLIQIAAGILFICLLASTVHASEHHQGHHDHQMQMKAKNPFDKKMDALSLHCLLKKHHGNHLMHCTHGRSGKEANPTLSSPCGKGSSSLPQSQLIKVSHSPFIVSSSVAQPHGQLRSLHPPLVRAPSFPSFEITTPPPEAHA